LWPALPAEAGCLFMLVEKTIGCKTIWHLDYARSEKKRKRIVELFRSFALFLDYIEPAQKG
jgi:hypothetical protein